VELKEGLKKTIAYFDKLLSSGENPQDYVRQPQG